MKKKTRSWDLLLLGLISFEKPTSLMQSSTDRVIVSETIETFSVSMFL